MLSNQVAFGSRASVELVSSIGSVEYPSPNRKKTGTTEQALLTTQARTTRQAPFIRVHHAGHAAHYILLPIRVFLWLAAHLPRMPLERRGTEDWLRPVWSNMSAPSDVTTGAWVGDWNVVIPHVVNHANPVHSQRCVIC
uniref:Uncharacterized protein n=1 Tax=Mesocestoides corti TaxID=53468 RepID=A0A5K3EQZ3_MESCO